jgi:hypothetical protein
VKTYPGIERFETSIEEVSIPVVGVKARDQGVWNPLPAEVSRRVKADWQEPLAVVALPLAAEIAKRVV